MAEVTNNGETVGGLPVPHPDEGLIREQNARRVARRAQANALALQIARVEGSDLDRFGDTRTVGGVFETLQDVPDPITMDAPGIGLDGLAQFLASLNFAAQTQILGSNSFLSGWGPGVLGTDLGGG